MSCPCQLKRTTYVKIIKYLNALNMKKWEIPILRKYEIIIMKYPYSRNENYEIPLFKYLYFENKLKYHIK